MISLCHAFSDTSTILTLSLLVHGHRLFLFFACNVATTSESLAAVSIDIVVFLICDTV